MKTLGKLEGVLYFKYFVMCHFKTFKTTSEDCILVHVTHAFYSVLQNVGFNICVCRISKRLLLFSLARVSEHSKSQPFS